jgi:uncharacterized protein YdhG (YjbR/CyaY superfamily)
VSKIDDYLGRVSDDKRTALDKLRKTIRSIVPEAEECISYGMPAFRLGGKVVAGFRATAKGCSFYPFQRDDAEDAGWRHRGLQPDKERSPLRRR